jgi:hypothetical protein
VLKIEKSYICFVFNQSGLISVKVQVALLDYKDRLAHRVSQVRKVLRVRRVFLGLKETPATLAPADRRERVGGKGLLEHLAALVKKDPPEVLVKQALKVFISV